MISENSHDHRICQQFHEAIELIGRRWTGAIIYALLLRSRRFSEFREAVPDMSDRLLTERLKELEAHQLIVREVVVGRPIHVYYHLTPKGHELQPILEALGQWAARWAQASPAASGCPSSNVCPELPTDADTLAGTTACGAKPDAASTTDWPAESPQSH